MIIGLIGYAGAGKTTAANLLAEIMGPDDTEILSVAAPIRSMLLGLGLQPDDFSHRVKERNIGWIGASPRKLMQTLGDWGRGVNQNLWVGVLETRMVTNALNGVPHMVVDDIRFANEAGLIRRMNGMLIRVTRPKIIQGEHRSERSGDMIDVDATVENTGTVEQLKAALEDAIQETV